MSGQPQDSAGKTFSRDSAGKTFSRDSAGKAFSQDSAGKGHPQDSAISEHPRAIGYLCPQCRKPVLGIRDPFTLAASDAAVSCDCGGSILRTEFDGVRFRITVPCGLCGDTHTALCPPERVLRDATALACARTGQFSCFIGPEGVVEQRLRDLQALAEREKQGESGSFLNDVVMYEVLSELKDIAARPGGITCRCGSARYRMEIRRAAVDLICASCGGKLRIGAASSRDLDDLCCQMRLVIPGRARNNAGE